jgi:hypothetical protein
MVIHVFQFEISICVRHYFGRAKVYFLVGPASNGCNLANCLLKTSFPEGIEAK